MRGRQGIEGSGEGEMMMGEVCLSPCAWFGPDIVVVKELSSVGIGSSDSAGCFPFGVKGVGRRFKFT